MSIEPFAMEHGQPVFTVHYHAISLSLVHLRPVLRQGLQLSRLLFLPSRSIALVVPSSSPSLAASIASW
jgi:hypothetical protein